MSWALSLGFALSLTTACGSDPAGGVGADADVGAADGGFIGVELGSGVGLAFVTEPRLPASYDHDGDALTLTEARFTLENLRLIGDAVAADDDLQL